MKISDLAQIKWKEIEKDTIIHYPEINDLCYRPYKNNKKGCPNIDKCNELNIPSFEIIDNCGEYNYYYLIYCRFDRQQYRKEMGGRDNLRWWQNSLKKLIKDKIEEIHNQNKSNIIYVYGCGSGFNLSFQDRVGSMEHCEINVFSTMKLNGIKMEINPQNIVHLVCLLCSVKKVDFNHKTQSAPGLLKFIEKKENKDLDIPCPNCGQKPMVYSHEVKAWGIMHKVFKCKKCGRHQLL